MEKYSKILIGSTIMLIMTICCPSRIAAQQYDTLPYTIGLPYYPANAPLDSLHVTTHDGMLCMPMADAIYDLVENVVIGDGFINTASTHVSRGHIGRVLGYEEGDLAFGFYPDSTIHVVGIAWAFSPSQILTDSSLWNWDSIKVKLYIPTGDYLMPVREKMIIRDTFSFKRIVDFHKGWSDSDMEYSSTLNPIGGREVVPLYEVFFDNEIDVMDSLYMSVKIYVGLHKKEEITRCFREAHTPYTIQDPVVYPLQSFRITDAYGVDRPWRYGEIPCYPLLFPIVRRECDSCPEVRGLRWSRLGSGTTAFVQWDAGVNHRDWQLSYGPTGTPAGEGTVVDCPPAQCVLPGLAAGVTYDIYVRARCRFARDEWTGWSGPLEVGFGNPGEGINGTASDIAAELTPNPATGRVKVACAEAMRKVEVYDLQGRRCLAQEVQGTETVLDISALAAGRYTVLLHTTTATAARPLIVQ